MNRWKVDSIIFPTVYYMTYSILNILTKETPCFRSQIWTDFNRFVLLFQRCFIKQILHFSYYFFI